MKNVIYKTLLLGLIVLGMVGCSKDEPRLVEEEEEKVEYKSYTINKMTIGEYHNYLMITLSENANKYSTASDMDISTQLEADLKSILTKDLNISSKEYDDFIDRTKIKHTAGEDYNLQEQVETALSKLDNKLAEDLKKMLTMVDTEKYEDFLSYSDGLLKQYAGTEHELFINMVIDVAKSSHKHWFEDNMTLRAAGPPNSVWQADISGAVVGGTWGAVSGSFAGGIGALPGGLLGGCIGASYGSAAAGIWSFFN